MRDLSYSILKLIAYGRSVAGPVARLAAMVELERREALGRTVPTLK